MTSHESTARPVPEPSGPFAIAVRAFTAALGPRLAPGISTFPDLFTNAGVVEVPFDGDGTAPPVRGRPDVEAMVRSLEGVLRFDELVVTAVHDVAGAPTAGAATVVCEYHALLHRADLGGHFQRRYVAVLTLRDRRIAHLREYGGPLIPATAAVDAKDQ